MVTDRSLLDSLPQRRGSSDEIENILHWRRRRRNRRRRRRRRRGLGDGDVEVDVRLEEVCLTDVPAGLLWHGVLQPEGDGMVGDQRVPHILRAVGP